MTIVEQMGEFIVSASIDGLSASARLQLKIRILDALGSTVGAIDAEPARRVRRLVTDFSPDGACSLIGGGCSAPDRVALLNGTLVRYLDFNDSYLAPGETCHASDNIGAVLAAAELAKADGATLLTPLAVAYQVQSRLSDAAPVRPRSSSHDRIGGNNRERADLAYRRARTTDGSTWTPLRCSRTQPGGECRACTHW
jgi:2-methylcitrate dehydratase